MSIQNRLIPVSMSAALTLWVLSGLESRASAMEAPIPPHQTAMPIRTDLKRGSRVDNPVSRDIALTVPLRFQGKVLGSITLFIAADGQTALNGPGLIKAVTPIVAPEALASVEGVVGGHDKVLIRDLKTELFSVAYDQALLAVIFKLAPKGAQEGVISLTRARSETQSTRGVRPRRYSAYLNINSNLSYNWDTSEIGDADFFFELAARAFGGLVLEAEGVRRDGAGLRRQATRLSYDFYDSELRLTMGDIRPESAGGFQSAGGFGGFGLLKSRETFKPNRAARSFGRSQFLLENAATVEIYINGILERRLRLAAGPYDIRDFPLTFGSNLVELRITDDTGRVEVLRLEAFFDPRQLDPGEVQAFVGAGLPSQAVNDEPDYDTQKFVYTGYLRRGFERLGTLGLNVQGNSDRHLLGVEGSFSGVLSGRLDIQSAYSFGTGGSGAATAIQYTFEPNQADDDETQSRFSLSAEYRGEKFGGIDALTPQNATSLRMSANYSRRLGETINATSSVTYVMNRGDASDQIGLNTNLSFRLAEALNGSLGIRYSQGDETDYGVFAALTYRFGQRDTARVTADSLSKTYRASYRHSEVERIDALSYEVDVEDSESGRSVNAGANYTGNRVEFAANHATLMTSGGDLQQRTTLRAGTSIALAGGQIGIGRPVRNNFALLKSQKGIAGKQVFVDRTEDGDLARSGILGSAVVPLQSSYTQQTLTYGIEGVPIGIDVGPGAYQVFAENRSGFAFAIGSDATVTVIGFLTFPSGKAIEFGTGSVTAIDDPDFEEMQFFTNRVGRFAILGLRAGKRYRIKLSGGLGVLELEIPQDAEGLQRLGSLSVERQ